MQSYGFVSACYHLPENFLIPDMMMFYEIDKDYIRVFEDTSKNVLRIISGSDTLAEFYPAGSFNGSYNEIHYNLMTQLLSCIPANSRVMFFDISCLSEDAEIANILYSQFLEKGHKLIFVRNPWMNSENYNLPFLTSKSVTESLIRNQIFLTLAEINRANQDIPEIDIRNKYLYQLNEKQKKNRVFTDFK